MSKFSFQVSGLPNQPDVRDLELPDARAAWMEGLRACADMMSDMTDRLEPGTSWELQVVDQDKRICGTFRFSAEGDYAGLSEGDYVGLSEGG